MSKLYTNLANVYHEIYQTLFDYDQEFKFYDKHLQANQIRSVLEIGCGTGNLAKKIVAAGYDYLGVDLFDEMLTIARITAPTAKFCRADVRDLSFDKKFDCAIITGRTISYLIKNEDIESALICLNQSLNTNGILMFDAIDAFRLFNDFESDKLDTLTASFGNNHYKRLSKSKKNLTYGWTWDWESEYFIKNELEIYQKIGEDFSTLRAFLKEELSLFLRLAGFELVEILPKKSYAWDDNFYIARKIWR